jgi:hypothetical protein
VVDFGGLPLSRMRHVFAVYEYFQGEKFDFRKKAGAETRLMELRETQRV